MKKPKYGSSGINNKKSNVVGVFDQENDVEFNKNLSLNVTQNGAECDDDLRGGLVVSTASCSDTTPAKHRQTSSETVPGKPHPLALKVAEDKNVLLLRSVFANRPKVIFFQ